MDMRWHGVNLLGNGRVVPLMGSVHGGDRVLLQESHPRKCTKSKEYTCMVQAKVRLNS